MDQHFSRITNKTPIKIFKKGAGGGGGGKSGRKIHFLKKCHTFSDKIVIIKLISPISDGTVHVDGGACLAGVVDG